MNDVKALCALLLVLLTSGCGTLFHQVSPTEPHALLKIKRTDWSDDRVERIVRLDGRRVHCLPGAVRSYRVTPGEHTLVVEEQRKETEINRYAGAGALVWLVGSFALDSAGHHLDGAPPDKQYEVTTYSYITNTITVESGRVYVFEGPKMLNQTEGSNKEPRTVNPRVHLRSPPAFCQAMSREEAVAKVHTP
jgi:hypothetical protein